MAQDAPQEPNLSEHGAKLAPRWSYVGHLGAQDDQLGNIWRGFLALLKHLGRTFLKNIKFFKNIEKPLFFFGVLEVRALHVETFGGHVGASWRYVDCWAILSQLGDIFNQHGTQERQHEPRERKWAPGRGNEKTRTQEPGIERPPPNVDQKGAALAFECT